MVSDACRADDMPSAKCFKRPLKTGIIGVEQYCWPDELPGVDACAMGIAHDEACAGDAGRTRV